MLFHKFTYLDSVQNEEGLYKGKNYFLLAFEDEGEKRERETYWCDLGPENDYVTYAHQIFTFLTHEISSFLNP